MVGGSHSGHYSGMPSGAPNPTSALPAVAELYPGDAPNGYPASMDATSRTRSTPADHSRTLTDTERAPTRSARAALRLVASTTGTATDSAGVALSSARAALATGSAGVALSVAAAWAATPDTAA
jgi:hypothetical protein